MKRFLYRLCQWTWGLPQTLAGAVVFLRYCRCRHFWYQGALVTLWPVKGGSLSLGMFAFLYDGWKPADRELLAHEYGHTVQSLLLGPLYLLAIGLPSALWAGPSPLSKLRHVKKLPYGWLYTEKWADRNGRKFVKKPIPALRPPQAASTQSKAAE